MKKISLLIIFSIYLLYSQQDSTIQTVIDTDTTKVETLLEISLNSDRANNKQDVSIHDKNESEDNNIDTIIKYFTLIGSLLGLIAFFQNILSPIFSSNKKKWKELTNHINEIDLTNICLGIEQGNSIQSENLDKIETLIDFIEHDNEILHFKSVFNNKYKNLFVEFKKANKSLRNIVQVPLWQINGSRWMPNKKEYYLTGHSHENDMKYRNDLSKAYDIAKKMVTIFKNIGKNANKDFFDLLFFK